MTERRGGGVRFGAAELTAEELSLQAEVRAFLAAELGRDAGKRPGLNVLFMTGYSRNAIVHNGRLDQGVNMIQKPFTQAALAAKIRDLLD